VISRLLAAAAAVSLAFTPSLPAAQPEPPRPKLAVILVVDQMRADYVDRFQSDWTGGLKRLVTEGAWFRRAAYPYFNTVTCAGHATIATGAFPHKHGIFQNTWWDREARKQVSCNEDSRPEAADVGYGVAVRGGDSAFRLQIPTLTDQLRSQRQARVATIALKDRSAIMLAGHGSDATTWLGATVDGWMTSKVFTTEPVPVVQQFVEDDRMSADFAKVWTRLLPERRYTTPDEGVGEAPPRGWTRTFPHPLTGTNNAADATFLAQWERSPFADAYVGRFAAALAEKLKLGTHDGTDVLGVSFSSPDMVGHAFGPRSQEVQDMYAHLDRTIGTLFDRLDALVGRDQWVVALSADHGVTPIPEQLAAEGKDAGRINSSALLTKLQQVLASALGAGTHVAALISQDVYFGEGVYRKIAASPQLLQSVLDAIKTTPGVQRVLRAEDVRGAASSKDSIVRAAALSYVQGRSGDLLIVPKPNWIFSSIGTTHGSPSEEDQRVPILFMGRGIKAGRYDDAATPADIAPTLAAVAGVTLSNAEGHALTAALR
jgi:predicted AlkP superfamily pyrophosphatase or phosphodiesterase